MWNSLDQGLCIAYLPSSEEGLKFFISLVNLSFIYNENTTIWEYMPYLMNESWATYYHPEWEKTEFSMYTTEAESLWS